MDIFILLCTRFVSGVTFIGYAQSQLIEKQNNLNVFQSIQTKRKGLHMIVKSGVIKDNIIPLLCYLITIF